VGHLGRPQAERPARRVVASPWQGGLVTKKLKSAWRVWGITEDEDGPVLCSPFTDALRVAHGHQAGDLTFPSPSLTARCPRTDHVAPDPDCDCGLYGLPSRTQAILFCAGGQRESQVLTPVRVRGRVEPGPPLGNFTIGELRVQRLEIVGPGLIAPAHADQAAALEARYGISFAPVTLDTDPDRAKAQMREVFQQRQEDHLAAHPAATRPPPRDGSRRGVDPSQRLLGGQGPRGARWGLPALLRRALVLRWQVVGMVRRQHVSDDVDESGHRVVAYAIGQDVTCVVHQ